MREITNEEIKAAITKTKEAWGNTVTVTDWRLQFFTSDLYRGQVVMILTLQPKGNKAESFEVAEYLRHKTAPREAEVR